MAMTVGTYPRRITTSSEPTQTKSCIGGCFNAVVDTIVAIATEIYTMVKCGIHQHLGKKSSFTHFGLNPEELDAEQAKLPALLCLHGDKGNQACFYPWVKKLTQGRNVFTVNLDYDDNNPELHRKQLRRCIKKIK